MHWGDPAKVSAGTASRAHHPEADSPQGWQPQPSPQAQPASTQHVCDTPLTSCSGRCPLPWARGTRDRCPWKVGSGGTLGAELHANLGEALLKPPWHR